MEQNNDKRILPALSDYYDIDYCVIRDTIDFELLKRSGYRILPMHPMGMNGRTHEVYRLNPHTKRVIDAAPVSMGGITFDEFLKVFEKEKN